LLGLVKCENCHKSRVSAARLIVVPAGGSIASLFVHLAGASLSAHSNFR
jgi:hypothetical protein